MKRAFLLIAIATTAATLAVAVVPGTARACQYCRAAPNDPEAARMAALIHGGGGGVGNGGAFPLDATLGQYQAAPVSGELKTVPTADSIATNAGALVAPGPVGVAGAVVVHRAVPPPELVQPVVVSVVSAPKNSERQVVAADHSVNAAVAHWADFGLLGLVAAGGIFCWRTRR